MVAEILTGKDAVITVDIPPAALCTECGERVAEVAQAKEGALRRLCLDCCGVSRRVYPVNEGAP